MVILTFIQLVKQPKCVCFQLSPQLTVISLVAISEANPRSLAVVTCATFMSLYVYFYVSVAKDKSL